MRNANRSPDPLIPILLAMATLVIVVAVLLLA